MTRSFVPCAFLAFIAAISCATAGGGLRNYDSPCECARMKLWQDEYLSWSRTGDEGGKPAPRGWIGNDIFRVIVAAEPRKEFTNKLQKRWSSKNTAMAAARARTAQLLGTQNRDLSIHWADINGIGYPKGVMTGKEISELSKSGSIVCEEYDSLDRCLIIYEVRSKCLKYRVRWDLKDSQEECR